MIFRTYDLELVRAIAMSSEIYRHISDDMTAPDNWQPPTNGIYLATEDNSGVFAFLPVNGVTIEVHTLFAPGKKALEAAVMARQWIWDNTHYVRIVTTVPEYNRLALRLARKSGMTVYGYNEKSFLRGGVLMGQHLLGVSRCL